MRVIAKIPILYRGKQYKVGEELPTDDTEMLKLWEEARSTQIVPEEQETTKSSKVAPVQLENESEVIVSESKATPETAEAGLEGVAVNGETEENLIGKVPKTAARKKK